jgi:hypothetical protein
MIPQPSLYAAAPKVEIHLRALRTEAKRSSTAFMMPILVFILIAFPRHAVVAHWFMLL